LKEEEVAPYPDILDELSGVALATEEEGFQVLTDKLMPEFAQLVAVALDTVGLNPGDTIRQAHFVATELNAPYGDDQHPAVIKANPDEVVYEITFNLPNAGLADNVVTFDDPPVILPADPGVVPEDAPTDDGQLYPTQACRSTVGALPYNNFPPP
jgi:hypothetical protein